jgi:hypothetical protein
LGKLFEPDLDKKILSGDNFLNIPVKKGINRRSLDENPRPEVPLAKKLMVALMKNKR